MFFFLINYYILKKNVAKEFLCIIPNLNQFITSNKNKDLKKNIPGVSGSHPHVWHQPPDTNFSLQSFWGSAGFVVKSASFEFAELLEGQPWLVNGWMSRWKLGSKVSFNGLFHVLVNGVQYVGVIIYIHSRDIQDRGEEEWPERPPWVTIILRGRNRSTMVTNYQT